MAGESFFRYQASPVSKMMRPNCSQCGSSGIEWMAPNALLTRVPAEERARVLEGLGFSGPDGDAWWCGDCGGFGLFAADF